MKDVNTLVICKDNYKNETDWERAIGEVVVFLLKNDYIMTVEYEVPESGIVRIDYEDDHVEWGCHHPYWLSLEQAESIMDFESTKGDTNTERGE